MKLFSRLPPPREVFYSRLLLPRLASESEARRKSKPACSLGFCSDLLAVGVRSADVFWEIGGDPRLGGDCNLRGRWNWERARERGIAGMDWGNVTAEDLVDALREVDWSSPPRPVSEFFHRFTFPRSLAKWNSRVKCNLY